MARPSVLGICRSMNIYIYYYFYFGQLANHRTFDCGILHCKTKENVSKYEFSFLDKSNSPLCCCQLSVVVAPGGQRAMPSLDQTSKTDEKQETGLELGQIGNKEGQVLPLFGFICQVQDLWGTQKICSDIL